MPTTAHPPGGPPKPPTKPRVEPLPANLAEVQERWPRLLVRIMTEVRSPADSQAQIDRLSQTPEFMALVEGWENMPSAAQARAWNMIEDRLWEEALASRPFCLRCGECCRRGSPVLYEPDRPALASGAFRLADLVTLRSGQPAFSNRQGRVIALPREEVKPREIPGGRTCVFLGPGGDACLIYENRPYMCRVMECWDPSRFDRLLSDLPPLGRRDLLGPNHPLLPVLDRHEEKCALAGLGPLLASAVQNDQAALDGLLEMLAFDRHCRDFVVEQYALDSEATEFLFGPTLERIMLDLGFRLAAGPDGPRLVEFDAKAEPGVVSPKTRDTKE